MGRRQRLRYTYNTLNVHHNFIACVCNNREDSDESVYSATGDVLVIWCASCQTIWYTQKRAGKNERSSNGKKKKKQKSWEGKKKNKQTNIHITKHSTNTKVFSIR